MENQLRENIVGSALGYSAADLKDSKIRNNYNFEYLQLYIKNRRLGRCTF